VEGKKNSRGGLGKKKGESVKKRSMSREKIGLVGKKKKKGLFSSKINITLARKFH